MRNHFWSIKLLVGYVLFSVLSLVLHSCDDTMELQDVTVNGAVYRTEKDSGIFLDITQFNSPLYRYHPMVNGIPAWNYNQTQRYIVDEFILQAQYDSVYIMAVEIENTIITDTVRMPGNFRIYTDTSDTILAAYGDAPVIRWSQADSISRYFAEFFFYDNYGYKNILRQVKLGQDTTYSMPRFDAYGVFQLDVYAYQHSVYHPQRGQLTEFSKPVSWEVNGSWGAWVRRTITFWVL